LRASPWTTPSKFEGNVDLQKQAVKGKKGRNPLEEKIEVNRTSEGAIVKVAKTKERFEGEA